MAENEIPEARPDDLEFVLSWELRSGGLAGWLEARNVCEHPVRLSGKPGLTPIGVDGRALDTQTVVTLEARLDGYVELWPGERARAPASWVGWDGPPASGTVLVRWSGGQTELIAAGPHQPESAGPATNLFASWFERIT